jgi:putative hemolysin
MPVDPFSFDPPPSLLGRATARVARFLLSRPLGLEALRTAYAALPGGPEETFAQRVLDALSIDVAVEARELAGIPANGPVIVAANHPRGALDGLVLASLLRRVRPDIRLLANHLLERIPELRASCFFVDPFDGEAARMRSRPGLRSAHLWLRRGGAIVMFPSGEVAHRRDARGVPMDSAWRPGLDRLASATGAAIVPVFLDGANSRCFYAAGRIHPILRTALLPRELLAARRSPVRVRIGAAIAAADAGESTPAARARQDVERMARRTSTPNTAIAKEIAQLTPDLRLLTAGRFEVFCAPASCMPATLAEIGRLRAVSYRAAGEGTGADVDLDAFDHDYLHPFAWDRHEQRVVGAYRIGCTDALVRARGVEGLYTRTLFRYGPDLIEAMPPALELGRSFVRPEYQRDYQPLLLLWRGIGSFLVRHPHYRMLFGPVSISAAYSSASRTALTMFLERHHLDLRLARMVTPVHPLVASPAPCATPATVSDAHRLVASLEPDGKGMPVLLRHYLKLNARALGFSVDPGFGHVIDALMAVDLRTVSPAMLRRYLGESAGTLGGGLPQEPQVPSAA